MQILVVGMHRSGTSMVTRVLNLMGAYFGTEADGTGVVNEENPKGFWERRDVRRVNEQMLVDAGADWDRLTPWLERPSPRKVSPKVEKDLLGIIAKLEPQRPWMVKDPRLCLTLSAWLPRLELPHIVMPLRSPLEVASSLQNRNGFPLDVGLALWEAYTLEALRDLAGRDVHVIRYEALIADPVDEAGRLHEALTARGVDRLAVPKENELRAFIDPALYRSRVGDLGPYYHEHPAMTLYSGICAAGARDVAGTAGELSARSASELAAHERRLKKAKATAASSWQELKDQLLESAASEPNPSVAIAATVDRVEDEIALATGRAIERCRELRAEITRLQGQRREAAERDAQLEERLRKLEHRNMASDARCEAEAERRAALEAALADMERSLSDKVGELELLQDRQAALRVEREALQEALRSAEQAQSVQAQEAKRMRLQLAATLGESAGEAGMPLDLLVERASQRLALHSALGEQMRHLERLDTSLQGLLPQLHALQRSTHSTRANHESIGKTCKQIDHELTALHASRSWRAVDWLMRMAERVLRRRPAWVARHQSLGRAVSSMRGSLDAGDARMSSLHRDAKAVLEEGKTIAKRVDAIAMATRLLSAPGLFARHVALIFDARGRDELSKRYRNAPQEADARMRLHAEQPLVSIVMPTYNRAALIGEAIGSVLEQTYPNWELLVCDDGSNDDTRARVTALGDPRIRFLALKHRGAAAARNSGLAAARGRYIAYLDTDNLWHPEYLAHVVAGLLSSPGHLSVYTDYLDVQCTDGRYQLRPNRIRPFSYEALSEKNYIDLNAFAHDASLLRVVGGFTESLSRQQDWDLILKMTYLRDPLMIDLPLVLYRRNKAWAQITIERKADTARTKSRVQANVATYYSGALARRSWKRARPRLSVLAWDVCRNHFSKAYNLAEAAQQSFDPQLVGFHFFGPEVFEPYRGERPPFRTEYLEGRSFPGFFERLTRAWARIDGDAVYCVKPRLPSLGLALLANYHTGVPVILESNDSEAHVSDPQRRNDGTVLRLDDCRIEDLLNPYSDAWSQVMDGYAREVPLAVTHNRNLDAHYGGRGYCLRNLKDETHYDPHRYDREAIRRELGFGPEDRVILFGGLLRKHKGIHELVELVRSLEDPRYKLLFAGSRVSPDQERFVREYADEVKVLPPQGRNRMAEINYAADLVVLWLDPRIPASQYQMPYKFTDAIAMHVPVIANDISDLGPLASQGYLRLVEFGNFAALREAVRATFDNKESTAAMAAMARQLYLRQFSYAAANTMLKVLYEHADAQRGVLPVAERFAHDFAGFCERVRAHADDQAPQMAGAMQ
ncbi:glycosyltransferase [Luteimonas salinilitoris]|uniref:Glycosyltransferase n=1 Tax=Luteimonas salinilitoris TaxID=3237697 RepID=A0ABV4HU01_9GAMM